MQGDSSRDTSRPAPTRPTIKRNPKAPRQEPPLLVLQERQTTWKEVTQGLSPEQVAIEAKRCLDCKDPKCVDACPLHVDIRGFIRHLVEGDFFEAFRRISENQPFPGICGRVCQHELFCEKACLLGVKLEPVAIGALERFVADIAQQGEGSATVPATAPVEAAQPAPVPRNGKRVALVGSGPASLIAANDLSRKGYSVTVFEALHDLGGVLAYGIPPFRLPRPVIAAEIDRLQRSGVEFRTDFLVGKTASLDDLKSEGYDAVFVGTGAGLPYFMGIPGENLVGVYTANEFLTRLNLMHAHSPEENDTPIRVGQRTVVVGGGNSAMDAARWARRLGSETTVLFRRGRAEMRARAEEIDHAEGEGVGFEFLAAPVRLIGENGILTHMECIRMQLGEPDSSGRPSPVPIPGSEYIVPVDTVVAAVGQGPNPTLQRATPTLITKRGKIAIDDAGKTNLDHVFAGGDVVRGGSTVILAMKDGRAAAEAIHRALADAPAVAAATAVERTARNGHRIVKHRFLRPEIAWLQVEAPEIARHWKPGQFVIVRPTPESERIPLTLVDGDADRGTITLVVQALGKTSTVTSQVKEGECFADILGPLGEPATVHQYGTVVCAAGGVGVAELLPVAKAFREAGNRVVALCGARSKELILLDEELRAAVDEVRWATDDGSNGFKGNVVDLMKDWRAGEKEAPGAVHVIGPIPMMRAGANLTREWGVKTFASLNPIMVDGTGMCGGCRITVGDTVKFACVDGPEFDAHLVDFDELTRRNSAYRGQEKAALDRHLCRIGLGG